MNHDTLVNALLTLGFDSGWVVTDGVIDLWECDEPQPTEAELIAAGWIKPEAPASDDDAGAPSTDAG